MIFAAACTVGVKGSDPALESEQTTRRPLALPIRPRLKNPSAPTTRLECLTGSKERKGLLTSACDELLVAIVSTEQRERHNTEHPLAKPPPISKYQYSCHFQDLQLQQNNSHDEHSVLLLLSSCSYASNPVYVRDRFPNSFLSLSLFCLCATSSSLFFAVCSCESRGRWRRRSMCRLGDRFPLGSIGYGPVLGGYLTNAWKSISIGFFFWGQIPLLRKLSRSF